MRPCGGKESLPPHVLHYAARLNSGVRRGKKHSGSVASTSDAMAPGTSRRFCSEIPSGSARRAACRTLSSAASALSPVIGFPTVPLVRRLRFGHNDLVHRPLWCSRLAAGDSRITVAATACSRSASALTSRLTIRPSRRRFAARLNSGVRRGEKAFRVSGIDFGCKCTRHVPSFLFRHSFGQSATRRMSHVVIRSFGTVAGDSLSNCSAGAAPSLRSQRLGSPAPVVFAACGR